MKALALINHAINHPHANWQLDKILTVIAYDLDLSVVFMPAGISQLQNKAYLNLEMYGINSVFYLQNSPKTDNIIVPARAINYEKLKNLIQQAQLIL